MDGTFLLTVFDAGVIIDRDSFSASVSGEVAFAFGLYATLGRDDGPGGFDSSSSSPMMTTRLDARRTYGLGTCGLLCSHRRNPKA